MKPLCILLLTGTILATTVPLHAQVQSPSPAVTPTPVVYEAVADAQRQRDSAAAVFPGT